MSDSSSNKRPYRKWVWLSDEELAEIDQRAAEAGLQRADFMRRAIFGRQLRPRESQAKITAVNRVGGNLNQAAKSLNTLVTQAKSKRDRDELLDAADAVRVAADDVRLAVTALRESYK